MRKAFIIPHLPKTGGSTLIKHFLESSKTDYLIFHLGPRGNKGYNRDSAHFESVDFQSLGDKDIVVIGHHVDEGVLSYLKGFKVVMLTILREPIQRYISHYNMVVSNGNFQGDINQYIDQKRNLQSLFFVTRFPSLVEDALSSLQEQCRSVLDKFDHIYFLEDAPKSFNEILGTVDVTYDEKHVDTRRSNNYLDRASEVAFLKSTYQVVLPEIRVYQHFKHSVDKLILSRKLEELQSHIWYTSYCVNYISDLNQDVRTYMIDRVKDEFIKSILRAHISKKRFSLKVIISESINHRSLFTDVGLFYNLQVLLDYVIRKSTEEERIKIEFRDNDESNLDTLIDVILNEEASDFADYRYPGLLNVKNRHYKLELATAHIHFHEGNYTGALKAVERALSFSLVDHQAFDLLSKIFIQLGDIGQARRCLEKCMELKPRLKKYLKKYITL